MNEKPADVGAAHNLVNQAHKVADSAHNLANPAHKVRDLAHNKSCRLTMTAALAGKRGCLYENDRESAGSSLKPFILEKYIEKANQKSQPKEATHKTYTYFYNIETNPLS